MLCYQGDVLSVDADADDVVEARVRMGWNKFGQLSLYLPIRMSHFL